MPEQTPAAQVTPNAAAPAVQPAGGEKTLDQLFYGNNKPADETPKGDSPASAAKPKVEEPAVTPPTDASKKPDDKPVEEKPKEETPKEEEKPKEGEKPVEKYELKLPKDSLLSAEHVAEVESFAKDNGLSKEAAQAVLERESKTLQAYAANQQVQLQERKNTWLEQVQNDKEIGGAKMYESAERAKRFVNQFGSEALKKELDVTGFGNHPEVIRMMARVHKQMFGEDDFIKAGETPKAERNVEDMFYPTHAQNK
jgi:hypothetical protein